MEQTPGHANDIWSKREGCFSEADKSKMVLPEWGNKMKCVTQQP